ncbi:MAG: hypothetical protein RLZZ437_642, partial [Pseudomonadota bacterium]
GGWDNRTFRLGDGLLVRLPSAERYAAQVKKEQRWLPVLAQGLPVAVPRPVGLGRAGALFAWTWSVYEWIEGETVTAPSHDVRLARAVAGFLRAIWAMDTAGGPAPGAHNFERGGRLAVYDAEARAGIAALTGRLDAERALALWERALRSAWQGPDVWVHGDMAAGNMLLRDGELAAIIDFGGLAVGDPACDLVVARTLFEGDARAAFVDATQMDAATWNRARGWALWKAVIVAAGLQTDAAIAAQTQKVIAALLADEG